MNTYNPCESYAPPTGRLAVLGKVRAEIDTIRKGIDLHNAQIGFDDRRVSNEELKTQVENQALQDKTTSEVSLLDQKAVTELSQTSDYIPSDLGHNNSTNVQGIIEKQKGLFQKQTDGFDRDAEQKLAKIMVDTWSVRQTTDTADAAGAGLADTEINSVLNKAKDGIDV